MTDLKKITRLFIEMSVVGISLAILGLLVGYASDLLRTGTIEWWPKHVWSMLVGTAVTGALFHFLFEVTGLNAYYCKNYERML